jgi:hypothetical protein
MRTCEVLAGDTSKRKISMNNIVINILLYFLPMLVFAGCSYFLAKNYAQDHEMLMKHAVIWGGGSLIVALVPLLNIIGAVLTLIISIVEVFDDNYSDAWYNKPFK